MRVKLLSDLHLEFYPVEESLKFVESIPNEGVDVLVLAGDIFPVAKHCEAYTERFADRFPHVIWVAGNHEFYGTSLKEGIETMRSMPFENLHVLEFDTVTIDSQRFVGCTLWYDTDADYYSSRYMNDFNYISGFYFDSAIEYARQSKEYLQRTVQQDDVVVTHMLPSNHASGEKYKNSPINCFYIHDCDDILAEHKPKAWFHGHSHEAFNAMVNETKVVRNPRGYPGQRGVRFNLDFLLEL